ncbi:MAG: GAF domain-containing protein [Nitrospiraceae bacterium]|nr:GAF domain-containing protein [Nitrospiraceae bacterium]
MQFSESDSDEQNRKIKEEISHRVKILNRIYIFIVFAILLLIARFLYSPSGHTETLFAITVMCIAALLIVAALYQTRDITKNALDKIDDHKIQLRNLLKPAQDIRDIDHGEVLLESIVEYAVETIKADAASLLFIEKDRLVFRIVVGSKRAALLGLAIPKSQGIGGWIVEKNSIVSINNVMEDSRFYPDVDKITGYKTNSILCAPVFKDSTTIGVLELINKKHGSFSDEDKKLIAYYADQISIAIGKDFLYKEQQRNKKYIENILDIIEEANDEA